MSQPGPPEGALVSVVIPTRDRALLLRRAVASVLDQCYTSFELLIVDDHSTDETASLVESYDDPRVRLLHNEGKGAASARNTGLRAARGAYVTFLDSDDEAAPAWLSTLCALLGPGRAVLAFCGCTIVHDATGARRHSVPHDLGPCFHSLRGCFLAGTFMCDRHLLLGVGGYTPGLQSGQHTDVGMRIAARVASERLQTAASSEALVTVHVHEAERIRSDLRAVYAGALYFLEHREADLRRQPGSIARYAGLAAVAAFRLRRYAEARALACRAVTNGPWRVRAWLRWLAIASWLPARLWYRDARAC